MTLFSLMPSDNLRLVVWSAYQYHCVYAKIASALPHLEMAWREILAGDGVTWREISQKLSFCTEWEENEDLLAAPALHTTEIECIF
jgi:hypothetical protein